MGSFGWLLFGVVTGDPGSSKHSGHCQFDRLYSVQQGISTLACIKGVGFVALSMKWKTKSFLNDWKMSQIIVEQQFHDDKHFPNAIYANRDAKLENFFACGDRQSSLGVQNFRGGENFH